VIGTVGALTPVKGHDLLLRAHAKLKGQVWCVIAGEGPCRASLVALAEELGTSDRVVFAGFVREPNTVFAAIDVFCLSSVSEGLPLVLIEAIASRRPVVTTAVGGIPEALAIAGGGRMVSAADPDALAAELQNALAGSVATPEFPAAFRNDAMGASYVTLYREILGV
jgi:glycosyltransferase involved in cell wall biosynthesis